MLHIKNKRYVTLGSIATLLSIACLVVPGQASAALAQCYYKNSSGNAQSVSCADMATGPNKGFSFENDKCYTADGPAPNWPNTRETDCALDCSTNNNGQCDFVGKYLNPAINTLTVLFGLLATVSIILGGINYATSEGDPQKTSKAKRRIANTVIAVIAYLFLYGFLQFLVPGGIFH